MESRACHWRLGGWGVTLAALVLLLTACGPASGARNAGKAQPERLRIWYATDDPTEQSWVHTLAQRFEAAHPSVHVVLSTYSLDDMNDKMELALRAGNPPDLVYTTPRGPGLAAYVRAGQLRDLSTAAQHFGWAAQLRPGLLAEYNRLLLPDARANGPMYAVPYGLAAVAVLYNKTIFDKLGLHVPRSVADLEAAAVRARSAGYTAFGLGNADGWVGDDWWLTLANARVGPAELRSEQWLDPHFSFETPALRWAGATLQRWATQGYFTPNFGGLDAQDSVETFFDGHTAMQLISSTQNAQILSLAQRTKLTIGVFAFPSVEAGRPPVMPQSGYEGWAIPRQSRQPALALAFINHALSAPTARLLSAHGLLPARRPRQGDGAVAGTFQAAYARALAAATPGVYLDGAPVPNLNATMEANVQLLLQGIETPAFLTRSLQQVYASRGKTATSTRTDGEF